MNNYLAQIAARHVVNDQPMLTPAHSPIEKAVDDPFDRSAFPDKETTQPESAIRPAASISSPAGSTVPGPEQPMKENTDTTTPIVVKPVYLSKYVERNQTYGKDTSGRHTTKRQSDMAAVGQAFERKTSPLLPEISNPPAKTAQAAGGVKINPVQQQGTEGETPQKQQPILLQPTGPIKEQTSIIPTPAATQKTNITPVFLQPQAPLLFQEPLQKEKPLPSLVIGKITVEIVPAQKPVNKIINQVIKPQPSAASAQRSKSGFGLGQL